MRGPLGTRRNSSMPESADDKLEVFENAKAFQSLAQLLLLEHFAEVTVEWKSSRGATDVFTPDVRRYAPRADLAVGPYSISPGRVDMSIESLPAKMRPWFESLASNENPRCLLAIEVVFSGSAKHMLGDLLNASALGLYGLVISHERVLAKVHRNREYASQLATVGKIPQLFQNVSVVTFSEFVGVMRQP